MEKRGPGRPRVSLFDQIPEFFQVYLPNQNSQQLRIPPDFIKHFNGRTPKEVILKNLGGKIWHVDVEKDKGGLFLKKGWPDFVKDSSLELGEFLVFRYNGISAFSVRIFGRDGCKEEDDLPNDNTAPIRVKVEAASETESESERTCRKRTNSGKSQTTPKRSRGPEESSIRRIKRRSAFPEVAVGIKEEADQEVVKLMSKSKYPSLKLVMGPNFLQKGFLDIPKPFAKMHIKEGTSTVKLQISNKSWPVKTIPLRKNRLCGGWQSFACENSLELGDVCLFELIDRDDLVFKVTIFKHTS
ncbi:hypothetical protein LguiB_009147 [Lonicera macranthoides]